VKISLAASLFLLFAGFVLVLASEWTNALDGQGGLDRVHNAWFQSVTLRTAGFNSIPMESLRPATLLVMLVMMFIGGCPGGTAGGVKVTTVAILTFAIFDLMRGGRGVVVFGRRVSDRSLRKAAVIATLGLGGSIIATLAILLTQRMPADLAVFEVFSALGTVGLTLGATSRLDTVGRLVIIACMFVGRVGTLTLLMSPSGAAMDGRLDRPEEDVDVG
ncbi:MAG: potassium transporter TrkG, partial [Myxococcota bacterium]